MEPRIALNRDIDPLDHSPLVRGMVLAMSYADAEGGIGLTKSGAINRRFVHWAAERFVWPGYTSKDLFIVNKVLNERDMPPLWPVQDVLLHLKLMRRYKGTLRTTKRGRALGAIPRQLFDVVAPVYLYRYVHDDLAQNRGGVIDNWRVFLNVINIEARTGCTIPRLMEVLYRWPPEARYEVAYQDTRFALKACIVRPLCWLGLLWEDREGLGMFDEGAYHKTPLWSAALKLESDAQATIHVV
ncbi:hypothetical protein OCH239_21420 [Roseivivax halodurans JCM 10272]|uniref:Uncharacterized protein n=1 Tax=Roseivivax halodurans JCM 10272 TaxID=1449350 RepID=X7E3P3_9RHOB|nr:hypothetical protein [Roseivivax halodurans]ETX10572.1 hypothetical protein OCH239_21420 [Roseivivax halodurans JCM 10272]